MFPSILTSDFDQLLELYIWGGGEKGHQFLKIVNGHSSESEHAKCLKKGGKNCFRIPKHLKKTL